MTTNESPDRWELCGHDVLKKGCEKCRAFGPDAAAGSMVTPANTAEIIAFVDGFDGPPAPTPKPRRDWIQTLEGRVLTPRDLKKEQVGSIEEIAHALAGKVRFTGQTTLRYSVAEHCVRGSRLLPAAFAGAFLLHELSEVYLPDIAAPLKPFVSVSVAGTTALASDQVLISWAELERRHTATILDALGLSSIEPLIYSPEVKRMDVAMLLAEKRDLCGPEPEPWGVPGAPATDEVIRPWSADEAAAAFLKRFAYLFR